MRSMLRTALFGFAFAIFAASATGVAAQSKEPVGLGTWKVNVEKSKFSGPPPKSLTAKFEPAGKGVKVTIQGVNAEGKPIAYEYTANYDGKDVPVKGSPTVDTVSLRRVNDTTTVRTDKKDGKVTVTQTRVIAKDGKTSTVAIKGKNVKGEPVDSLLVFEKQ